MTTETTKEMAAKFPLLAEHLEVNGFDAMVTLRSKKAVAIAYRVASGGHLVFVDGSKSLFNRLVA